MTGDLIRMTGGSGLRPGGEPVADAQATPSPYPLVSVVVDRSEASVKRLNLAADLGRRFGTKLRVTWVGMAESDIERQAALAALQAALDVHLQGEALAVQWLVVGAHDDHALQCASEGADLVIGECGGSGGRTRSRVRSLTETLLARSTVPTLAAPASFHGSSIGKRVLVAWDNAPQSQRAVLSAMPLLRVADHVTLCSIARYPGDAIDIDALDESLKLGQQGVQPALVVVDGSGSPSDARVLLEQARGMDADLIVAGAFGHPRWQQRLVGGITRSLLRSTAVPLLMRH